MVKDLRGPTFRLERGAKLTRKWRRKRLISLNPDSEMARETGERLRLGHSFTGAARCLMASPEDSDPRAPSWEEEQSCRGRASGARGNWDEA